jgi:glycogen operon protein
LAFSAELKREGILVHLILNAYWEPLEFELPPAGQGVGDKWRRWIDTSCDSPNDIVDWEAAPLIPGNTYRVESRSVAVLYASTA